MKTEKAAQRDLADSLGEWEQIRDELEVFAEQKHLQEEEEAGEEVDSRSPWRLGRNLEGKSLSTSAEFRCV